MEKRKRNLVVFLGIALALTISGILVLSRWNKPLGPGIALSSYTPSAISSTATGAIATIAGKATVEDDQVVTPSPVASTQPQTTAAYSPTATSKPICSGPVSMTILVVGSDQRSTSYLYGLADSIYVAHIDLRTPFVMIIDFPRDLWVEIPDISDHYGITHGKINQAYLFGNPGMGYYDGPGEGPGLLARTLYHNFGLMIDKYIAINMNTFADVIDAVGGVDVVMDEAADVNKPWETPDPLLYLSAGINHLDGKRAVVMATNRIPNTFKRIEYQRIIFNALRDKALSPAMLPKLPLLVARFIGSVQTDLSPHDINTLVCLAQSVTNDKIKVDSFPQEMFTAEVTYDEYRNVTTFIYAADFDQIRAMMEKFSNGIWPFP